MTIKEIERRFDRLRPARLVVLARMPDGSTQEMSAPDYVEAVKDGADFIRVLRGNDLKDAHLILSTFPSVID